MKKLFILTLCCAMMTTLACGQSESKPGAAVPEAKTVEKEAPDSNAKPAGALSVSEWVKGEPVEIKAGDNAYVVEFWATWCPPCRKSIPHLTEIQKKYKDKGLIVTGISTEDLATVKPFVKSMGDDMDYHVAVDKNRQTDALYMKAYDQEYIPTAFVINKDAKVIWVGHPMDPEFEQAIKNALGLKDTTE